DGGGGRGGGGEAVLAWAHVERGGHENRVLVGVTPAAVELLALLADGTGFLLGIPGPGDRDFFAQRVLGAQRLAEPALVMRDQMRGGGENVAGGAVIALEPDHLGAGKVLVEAKDVVELGAAPDITRHIFDSAPEL